MPRSAYSFLAAALFLAPVAALAQTPGAVQAEQNPNMQGPNMPGPAMSGPAASGPGRNLARRARVNPLAGLFTPEQLSMFALENRAKLLTVPAEQRKAFRKQQVSSLLAMSQTDRQKLQMDLQAKWDALPPKQKNKIEARLAARQNQQAAAQ